jgi:PiT family inorganic phosphate transporter
MDWFQLALLLALALIFDFFNGFHDSANIVATAIASRALRPRVALSLAALAHIAGPFMFGVAVAKTVGDGLLLREALDLEVVYAALISAIVWNIVTWLFGIPSSSSHALLGGLLGAGILSGGLGAVKLDGLLVIILTLLTSPLIGFMIGFLAIRLVLFLARSASPKISTLFKRFQILTLVSLGLSHGTNDAQKTIGVITLGLVLLGELDSFQIPLWVIAISAVTIGVGTFLGGWRIIRTLGGKIYRIRPIHGFTSQIAGAAVILGAAMVGGPVSTTQVMSSAILGAGAGQRVSMVRWQILGDLLLAWLLTIPFTAALSAVTWLVLERIPFA